VTQICSVIKVAVIATVFSCHRTYRQSPPENGTYRICCKPSAGVPAKVQLATLDSALTLPGSFDGLDWMFRVGCSVELACGGTGDGPLRLRGCFEGQRTFA
jgi:hypothetical protein